MPETQQQIFYQMGAVSQDGYFIYEIKSSNFHFVNSAFCKIVGFSQQEVLADSHLVFQCVHPEDIQHVRFCYNEILEEGGSKKYVCRLLVNNDDQRIVKCSVVLSQDGEYIYGMVDDITIRQENKIHIEQINARKNITLEVLSHDLKEPLGMIKMTVSSIENQLDTAVEESLRDSLRFISDMCERNLKLVRSMVNHEFLKSTVISIKKERADLVWELLDVVRFYNRSHLSKIRNFNFRTSHDKIFLFLDSMKFLQVVNNLISNAIKFTADGGIIDVGIEDRGEIVVVSVADNGIGIPQEIRNNLFQHNKEVLRKGLAGESSGGLGMSIIKNIVDLHRGRIWFLSEEHTGTTFFIELPKD